MALGAILLAVTGIIGFTLIEHRQEIARSESARLEGVTRQIEGELAHHLESAVLAINMVTDDRDFWINPRRPDLTTQRLQALAGISGAVRTLLLLDGTGRVIASSWKDILGSDFSTRPFYTVAREHPLPGHYRLSPPFKTARGDLTMVISRATYDTGGRLTGVLVAGFNPEFFASVIGSASYAPDMQTGLTHSGGNVFLFSPRAPDLEGRNLARAGTFFSRHLENRRPVASYEMPGENRLMAVRTMALPGSRFENGLLISASRQTSAIYDRWQKEALSLGSIFLVLLLVSAASLRAYQMRRHRFDAAEMAHQQQERKVVERLRLATETARIGVWELEPVSRRLTWDAAMFRLYGRQLSTDSPPYSWWRDSIVPEDLDAVDAALQGSIGHGSLMDTSFRIRRGDGEVRMIRVLARPFRGEDGQSPTLIGISEDITERWRAEADVRKLAHALEQSANAVLITDAEGRIEYVNKACCDWYGYPATELIGKNPRQLRSGLTPAEVYSAMWTTINAGAVWKGEICNRRSDGDLLYVSLTISPLRDASGTVSNYVAIQEDTSVARAAREMQKEVEARQARVERMEVLGAMAGGVSHDFNNILVAILGYSGLGRTVAAASGANQKLVAYFEEIELAGERARDLVQQLLTFSRGGRVAVQPVSVGDVVREVSSLIRVTFPAHVALTTSVAEHLPPLMVDHSQLHQVLMNLCANARDALDGTGKVRVAAERVGTSQPLLCDSCHQTFAGDYVRISVHDDGPGIDSAIRDRAFEPFVTTKGAGQGVGMGLAVVHGVTHLYDGHVRIDSPPGHGTEIAIYMPLEPFAGAALAPEGHATPPAMR